MDNAHNANTAAILRTLKSALTHASFGARALLDAELDSLNRAIAAHRHNPTLATRQHVTLCVSDATAVYCRISGARF